MGLDKLVIKYENSIVKNKNGETIAVLNGDENREVVPLSDMAEYLPIAFVSIEDERFYDHFGIDVKRTAGAAVQYVLRRGDYSFGGSTITQQLVKNLTNEKEGTISRKITEMGRAYYIEKELSKTQILELYLNLIFMGGTSYGVEVGSIYYFNKSCSELTLAECAFLAGINDSPNMYDPFSNEVEDVEGVKSRTKIVLNKMKELGKIKTEEEYTAAMAEVDSGLKFKQGKIVENVYSYHTDAALTQIINELMAENDWDYETARLHLFSSGYTIYTTEDPDIQKTMEEEFAKSKYQIKSVIEKGKTSQAGMALIDHKTGYVLAVVGKLGDMKDKDSFGFNRATQNTKQVGSSMKPIAVLAPAIDQGVITAATGFDDVPARIGGTQFKNYSGYQGMITMRKAVALSENIPFVRAMVELTPDKSMEFLESVGIDNLVEADSYLGLGLGGLTVGTSPLKVAGAYAAIANEGEYITPTFYTKVADGNGNTIIEAKQERKIVMSKAAAYVVKEMLTECVRSGTSPYCAISGMSTAAKTGTTNDDFDRWLCGFTPYYTAATWFGFDKNEEVNYRGSPGNPAAGIWIGVMKPIHEDLEAKKFSDTRPDGVTTAAVCNVSGLLPTDACKHDPRGTSRVYTEFFVKGTVPTKSCDVHVEAEICDDTKLLATEFCPHKTKGVYLNKPDGGTAGPDR